MTTVYRDRLFGGSTLTSTKSSPHMLRTFLYHRHLPRSYLFKLSRSPKIISSSLYIVRQRAMSSETAGTKRTIEDIEIPSPVSSEGSLKRVKHEHDSTSLEENTQADIDTEMTDAGQGSSQPAATTEGSKGKGKGKGPRDKRNLGRRARGREDTPRDPNAGPKEPRLPKRQTAILLGFCGSKYRGMQLYVL